MTEGRKDEEDSSEMEAVTGYQLYLDGEPEEMRSGDCSESKTEREKCWLESWQPIVTDKVSYCDFGFDEQEMRL